MSAEMDDRNEPCPRPPHIHAWVEDGRYTDTGDWREKCVECGAERSIMPWELEEEPK